MDCDDVSGSSLSSSEWEDLGSDLSHGDNDGREVGIDSILYLVVSGMIWAVISAMVIMMVEK